MLTHFTNFTDFFVTAVLFMLYIISSGELLLLFFIIF